MGYIYTITCNSKIYVGSTTRLFCQRIGDHKSNLRNNKHSNIHLQRAFNKYGEENFKFEILEEYPNDVLVSMEQFWINMLNSYKLGYNRNPNARNSYGIKRSQECKDKNRESGNWKKANEARRGTKHTEESKQKIKFKRSLQIMTPWTKERKIKASIIQKEIAKTRIVKAYKFTNNIIAYKDNDKLLFTNLKDACNYFKCKNANGIRRVLRKERTFYKGYKWEESPIKIL